jgi:GTP cyclohydrolase I
MNSAVVRLERARTSDVQAQADLRGVRIDRVGIRRLRYPILVDTSAGPQRSVAEWELTVELDAEQRGTHMSRFVESLADHQGEPMSGRRLLAMLEELRERLDAPGGHAHCTFPMFLERAAPVSGLSAQHAIDCCLDAAATAQDQRLLLGVRVPITTLCPCSKEISEYGAHNQRGYVEITVRTDPQLDLSFEDLIVIAEGSGSAVIYPLLKRVDERHVTMQAYDSPTFVEDVVRNATLGLAADERIIAFTVEAENHESIHAHSAVASVRWERA